MNTPWDESRAAEFLASLREDIARYGEPLASNVELDEIDPAKVAMGVGAGMVVTEDEHLVFVRLSAHGDWLIAPGGGVEAGESASEAFVREVREETGMNVETDTLALIYAIDTNYTPEWPDDMIVLWVEFIGYSRSGRLNDCPGREDDITEAVAIRCDEVDPAELWSVLDRLVLHYTACGPPEISRESLLDEFRRLGRRWPSRLED